MYKLFKSINFKKQRRCLCFFFLFFFSLTLKSQSLPKTVTTGYDFIKTNKHIIEVSLKSYYNKELYRYLGTSLIRFFNHNGKLLRSLEFELDSHLSIRSFSIVEDSQAFLYAAFSVGEKDKNYTEFHLMKLDTCGNILFTKKIERITEDREYMHPVNLQIIKNKLFVWLPIGDGVNFYYRQDSTYENIPFLLTMDLDGNILEYERVLFKSFRFEPKTVQTNLNIGGNELYYTGQIYAAIGLKESSYTFYRRPMVYVYDSTGQRLAEHIYWGYGDTFGFATYCLPSINDTLLIVGGIFHKPLIDFHSFVLKVHKYTGEIFDLKSYELSPNLTSSYGVSLIPFSNGYRLITVSGEESPPRYADENFYLDVITLDEQLNFKSIHRATIDGDQEFYPIFNPIIESDSTALIMVWDYNRIPSNSIITSQNSKIVRYHFEKNTFMSLPQWGKKSSEDTIGLCNQNNIKLKIGDLNPEIIEFNGRNLLNVLSLDAKTSVNIYPNPASNYIWVDYKTDLEYGLYTMKGQKIKSGKTSNKQINLEGIDNGLYLLQLKGFKAQKIIVDK